MSAAVVLAFDSTHLAMWAEEVAREKGVPAEVVPAPPGARSTCGLALRVPADRADALEGALRAEGIAFERPPA